MVVSNPQSEDYYEVLGVPRSATAQDIKRAYRKLAMKYHPDKHTSKAPAERDKAEAIFKRISEANDTLSDQDRRKKYDMFGKDGANMPGNADGSRGGFQGSGFHFGGGGGGAQAIDPEVFAHLFGGMNGGMPAGVSFGAGTKCSGGGIPGSFSFGHNIGGMGVDNSAGIPFDLGALFGNLGGGIGGMGGSMGGSSSEHRGGKRRRPNEPSAIDALATGTTVTITGLDKRADLNGAVGTVQSFERGASRYLVTLRSAGQTISLKPCNVVQSDVSGVTLINLQSKPGLNGRTGNVTGFDQANRRYIVQMNHDNTVIKVRENALLWPRNTLVCVNGLKSSPQHNGKWGRVINFDGDRYFVQLDDQGSRLRLKPQNVAVAAAA